MSRSPDSRRPGDTPGQSPTEADAAGAPGPLDVCVPGTAGQPPRRGDDAGLASTGEALNAGQVPQVGPDKDEIDAASDPAGGTRAERED